MNAIQTFVSVLIVFPVVVFIAVWLIAKLVGMKKRRRTGLAADITTIVLFFAVAMVADRLNIPQPITNLLIFLLVIGIIFIALQWKRKRDVKHLVILRILWRIYFLVLSTLYFLGWVIGIFRSIAEYVSG